MKGRARSSLLSKANEKQKYKKRTRCIEVGELKREKDNESEIENEKEIWIDKQRA